MPSYFNRRTIGGSDSSRHRIPSGRHDIRAFVQFTPVGASQQRDRGKQDQHHSCPPSATPQGFVGYAHDPIGGSIPAPPGHTYDNPSLRCLRCRHPFTSQADLDRHSFVCGAAALLTGMFIPWSAQQNDQYQQPHLHLQAPHSEGGYHQTQYPNHDRNRRP